MKYDDLVLKYQNFIYHGFDVLKDGKYLTVTFDFEIEGLQRFNPYFKIPKSIITNDNINEEMLNYLIFNIGMVESISYYKITCPKNYIIRNYFLDEYQKKFWNKLFYLGLGEFLYRNSIDISSEELVSFETPNDEKIFQDDMFKSSGNIIPVGGGKDSCVTLELLKNQDNMPFTINAKDVHKSCIEIAGYNSFYNIERVLDKKMLDLNAKGYLNGHTPFSALVAFYSYLVAYLTNRKYIILSNEASANEPTVLNTVVNHQYSKSFEFENDFVNYSSKYFKLDIHYFSLLRPIREIRVAYLFSKYEKYHNIFKSCNVGSKTTPWQWCGSCPKCLFVFCILSAFLNPDDLNNIFNKDLFADPNLLETFKELLGYSNIKPFECVGECDEVKWAISKCINNYDGELPYLLKYYNDNYPLYTKDLLNEYNEEHLIPKEFNNIIKGMMNND